MLLYTDGVSEAEDAKSAQFGMERLEAALLAARGRPTREVVGHVIEQVAAFVGGAPQSDDITCVALARSERPAGS